MNNDKGFLSGSITILIGAVIAIMGSRAQALADLAAAGAFSLSGDCG